MSEEKSVVGTFYVPDSWEAEPETILVGYYENQPQVYVIIYPSVQKAIAVSPDCIKEVPWESPDLVTAPLEVKELAAPEFVFT